VFSLSEIEIGGDRCSLFQRVDPLRIGSFRERKGSSRLPKKVLFSFFGKTREKFSEQRKGSLSEIRFRDQRIIW
jgi:hypothetical protein